MDSRAITHRLEILERWSAAEAARLALHAPYTEVRVCSISQDRACVVHHPEGNYGVSDRLDEIPILEAVGTALRLEGAVFVRMEFSPEWLHCLSWPLTCTRPSKSSGQRQPTLICGQKFRGSMSRKTRTPSYPVLRPFLRISA